MGSSLQRSGGTGRLESSGRHGALRAAARNTMRLGWTGSHFGAEVDDR